MGNLYSAFYKIGFIHRDMHLQNIIIHNNDALVIDYGESLVVPPSIKDSDDSFMFYYLLLINDYIRILNELNDIYINLPSRQKISNSVELMTYLMGVRQNNEKLKYNLFLQQVDNMQLISYR